ncbi:50S ribosomal protein L25/general stress protein Ctc [Flavobacteriaceae bacterium AU392]|nr:50S ribosomal protein L25/general stress protein Ctc [Flavobacteriaceae bacterium]RKM84085.1 50S ribosomal protein L25/general stress protein Ctc [Flavobacteriaceae bacterium AU392]
MKSITINGSKRESVGKKSTKALRNAGQVPCVLYGGDQSVHFSASELAFSKLVYTPNAHTVVIALESGETFNAVLQDIQFHPVTDKILHIDFYQLFEDKEIAMDIPVRFSGNSRGVLNGGNLRKNRRKLRVKALPVNLPDFIDVDITPLKIGSKLYLAELENDTYRFLHSDNTVVCQVKRSRVSVDDEDEDEDEDVAAEGAEAPAAEAAQE